MPSVRVVIADADAAFRELLREQFRLVPDLDIVGEARDGREALAAVGLLTPDILILDLDLPGLNALEVLLVILWSSPQTKVIVISRDGNEEAIREALRHGARGYVVKGDRLDLSKLIRAVQRGEMWARRRVLSAVVEELAQLSNMTISTPDGESAANHS
ncbi:response regulator [Candidatus Methylomirabilis sp.]|uniref:response regulator n=1 Tax=Candidatus Methylomirabilis sp. TaxID=2032687 RepID=UPI003C76848A